MKQLLLRSKIGHLALSARDKVEILHAALMKPEQVGTLANDQLATYLVTRLCKRDGIFVDVGAHIGSIVAEVKRYCAPYKIHAIEAIPAKADNLYRLFPDIDVHKCAVGNHNGEVTFYVNIHQSGYSSLIKPTNDSSTEVIEINVPLRILDDLIPHQGVDVMKLDVEGAELDVLLGSIEILKTSRPVLLFESAPGDEANKIELMSYFQKHEYDVFVPNRLAHNGPGLGLETFIEGHLYPRRATNYFAVPKERRIEMRDRARTLLNINGS